MTRDELIEAAARAMFEALPRPEYSFCWETPWIQEPEEGDANSLADVYRIAARAALAVFEAEGVESP